MVQSLQNKLQINNLEFALEDIFTTPLKLKYLKVEASFTILYFLEKLLRMVMIKIQNEQKLSTNTGVWRGFK